MKRDASQHNLGKPSEGGNPPSLLVALGLTQKLKDRTGEGESEKDGDKARDSKRKGEKLLLEGKVKEYVTHEMSTVRQWVLDYPDSCQCIGMVFRSSSCTIRR